MTTRVSLICTVLNEEGTIGRLLDSIIAQTRQPDDVIFVDGGSSDRTPEVIRSYQARLPLRVVVEPGCNISEGRNCAVRAASGVIIACTDAGVVLEPGWLAALIAPFEGERPPAVVCGFFVSDPRTPFEVALGATVLLDADEIDTARFLPSSRSVAFSREAWEAVRGYPEWLDYCEDLVFDMKARKQGYSFAWAPRAIVHFRPRPSLGAFFRQYYCYARGDGKSDLWRKRHAVRYTTYFLGLAGLVAGFRAPWIWLLPVAGGAVYLQRPYRRLYRHIGKLRGAGRAAAISWVPVIRVAGDTAKMVGYPAGLWWRLRNRWKVENRKAY